MKFTIMGHSSYIARHLFFYLRKRKHEVTILPRYPVLDHNQSMGHLIYCIGFTADFRKEPLKVLDAHCGILGSLLEKQSFQTLTYLSSTRVYQHSDSTEENSFIRVNPSLPGDIYNISKIMGESMCLNSKKHGVKIVRLSNVYGVEFDSQNYLDCLVRSALNQPHVSTQASIKSEKDYVHICDVVEQIYKISTQGSKRIYNIASGSNTKSGDILDFLQRKQNIEIHNTNEVEFRFPTINIQNIRDEFGFTPLSLFTMLEKDMNALRKYDDKN